MQLFYEPNIVQPQMSLSAENIRHIIQVLRMQVGDSFMLTNGAGLKCKATITTLFKKECVISIADVQQIVKQQNLVNIGIAFTKNNSRIEWLLEKITEIGVANIYPLHTKRTEQLYPKKDRLQHILISAMCQSQQYYLPVLHDIITLQKLIETDNSAQKLVAHCIPHAEKKSILQVALANKTSLILIGPEGDFTQEEVDLCLANDYMPVSLGNTRLRTETAGLVAVTILNQL